MDWPLIRGLIVEKLCDRGTYTLSVLVGTVINLYGQILVPWLRGSSTPFADLAAEAAARPWLMTCSVALGYMFPLMVSVYSAVVTRYRNRALESRSRFPDLKPDPVFRAARDGAILDCGETTRTFFDAYGVGRAQDILGEETWRRITDEDPGLTEEQVTIHFAPEGASYIVAHARGEQGAFNLYLTRLVGTTGTFATTKKT